MDPQALRPSRYVLRASVLLALFVLAACGARTNVSATSNVTALYSHVWITVQEVDFNTSATAAPGDKSWLTFPLSTPQTFDLATVTNGGLAIFGSSLNIPQGTYAQMRLLLTDSSATLATSAQTITSTGTYNANQAYTLDIVIKTASPASGGPTVGALLSDTIDFTATAN